MKTGSRRSTKNGRGGVRRKLKLISTTSNTRTLKDLLTKESFVRQSRRREEELEQFPPQKKHISSSHFQKKLLDSDSSQSNNGLLLSPSKSEINLDFRYIKRFGDAIFFCTPDYITPECQNLFNNLDCNKENLPCPESPVSEV